MDMYNEEYKYNAGCHSCGYKVTQQRVDINRVLEKLDECFDRDNLPEAERVLNYWYDEACHFQDERGQLSLLSEAMGLYRKTKNEEKGLEAVDKGLRLIEKLGMQKNVSAATIYLNAATTLKSFGKAEEGLKYYEIARQVYEDNLEPDDANFAGFWNNYGLALVDMNRTDEAMEAYKKAIAIMENKVGGKPEAAISHINMAEVLYAMGEDYDPQVNEHMNKAYELLTAEDNIKDGNYYFVLSKCFSAFGDWGRQDIADNFKNQVEAYYDRA